MNLKISFERKEAIKTILPKFLENRRDLTKIWKRSNEVKDEITMNVTGRNIRNHTWQNTITFRINDYLLENRYHPLIVKVSFSPENLPMDIEIITTKDGYPSSRSVKELMKVIIETDKLYHKSSGILYQHPVYMDELILEKLRTRIESIKNAT